jgi:hypothetical protein
MGTTRWPSSSTAPQKPTRAGTLLAGLWASVDDSVFINVQDAAIWLGNTSFQGVRRNYSRGGNYFIYAGGQDAAAPTTMQDNTILDPVKGVVGMGNYGPLLAIDNVIRARSGIAVQAAFLSPQPGDIMGLGNRFSTSQSAAYTAGTPGTGRLRSVDDIFDATVGDPGPPTLPGPPPNLHRPVYEVQGGDVQGAIDAAVASGQARAVVHVPYGDIDVDGPIVVPAGTDIQIVGDGLMASQIGNASGSARPALLTVQGPTHAVVRDLTVTGNLQAGADSVHISGIDQPGGLIHGEGVVTGSNTVSNLDVDGVSQTTIQLFHGGTAYAPAGSYGYRVLNGGKPEMFDSASAANSYQYGVFDNSTLLVQTMYDENNPPVTILAPNGSGTVILDNGRLQADVPSDFDSTHFAGLVTVDGQGMTGKVNVKAGPNTLLLGTIVGTDPTLAGSPSAWWGGTRENGQGGVVDSPEQTNGVTDEAQFVRDHFEPIRHLAPLLPGGRPVDVTDLALYRVGTASGAARGFVFRGSGS